MEEAVKSIPGFAPPSDYKKQSRLTEKVFIPYRDFPEINFIGQLIGPRGKTLQKMEADSGAKISIRGKGSVKDGKISNNGSEEEDQHCLIMADSEEKIKKAVKLILDIIEKVRCIESCCFWIATLNPPISSGFNYPGRR